MAEARHRAIAALAAIACAGLAHAACDAPEQHQLDFWCHLEAALRADLPAQTREGRRMT